MGRGSRSLHATDMSAPALCWLEWGDRAPDRPPVWRAAALDRRQIGTLGWRKALPAGTEPVGPKRRARPAQPLSRPRATRLDARKNRARTTVVAATTPFSTRGTAEKDSRSDGATPHVQGCESSPGALALARPAVKSVQLRWTPRLPAAPLSPRAPANALPNAGGTRERKLLGGQGVPPTLQCELHVLADLVNQVLLKAELVLLVIRHSIQVPFDALSCSVPSQVNQACCRDSRAPRSGPSRDPRT